LLLETQSIAFGVSEHCFGKLRALLWEAQSIAFRDWGHCFDTTYPTILPFFEGGKAERRKVDIKLFRKAERGLFLVKVYNNNIIII
jgi:hypothetical protein